MNSDASKLENAQRLFAVAMEHADAYKAHFHAMQERAWQLERKLIKSEKRNRTLIDQLHDYEKRLGIDDI